MTLPDGRYEVVQADEHQWAPACRVEYILDEREWSDRGGSRCWTHSYVIAEFYPVGEGDESSQIALENAKLLCNALANPPGGER